MNALAGRTAPDDHSHRSDGAGCQPAAIPADPLPNGATEIYASGSLMEELNEVVSVLGRLRFGRRVAVIPKG